MRRRTVGGLVALATLGLAALAVVATGSAAHKAQAAPIKAAWIYVGPHNDGGWSQAHDAGRLYVQKQLGTKVETTYKENVPEGPQVAQVIDSLVRDGNKIIFATSFGYRRRDVRGGEEVPGREVRARDRATRRRRTSPSTTAPARTRSTCPAWRPARPPRRA